MAFFKLRKGGDEQPATAAQSESVEVLRRRAKNRLIGSAILVLIGVIGFPLLVDKQPRPVAVDLPIEIPDKNKVVPLAAPVPPAPAPGASTVQPAPTSETTTPAAAPVGEAAPPAEPVVKQPAKPQAKPAAPAAAKTPAKATGEGRYVVQIGAFAEEGRAREARHRLERAGLKNYAQVVETRDGRRIRVRAGPFASKAEADRAAEKIRKLDLPVTVLTL